eukprot:NODE_53_length_26956_cov_0.387348.p9 type:complete len:344 gc:universal NODE_53_length_26956_cov_0.387348:18510-17479(-)
MIMPIWAYWLITLYLSIGMFILPLFSRNHIIKCRNLALIYVVNLASLIAYQIIYWELPCILVQILGRVLYFTFILKATLYHLITTEGSRFLKNVCLVFWSPQHNLKVRYVFIVGVPFIAINLSVPIAYFIINGYSEAKCNKYPSVFVTLLFYAVFLILMIFAVSMYWNGKDMFNLRLEFLLFLIHCIFMSFLFLVTKPFFNYLNEDQNMCVQLMIFTFYSTYYPLIIIAFNRCRRKIQISGRFYLFDSLYSVAKKHYCDENVLFLEAYQLYLMDKSKDALMDINTNFIERFSSHQLNISENLRDSALSNPENLEIVNDHVLELVQCNILPHMDTDKSYFPVVP